MIDRRTFLLGTSAFALSTAATKATPLPLAPMSLPVPKQTGAISQSLMATAFNGGRSQVNLNFLQVGGDYPFLNLLKNAQAWSLVDNSGWPEPSTLDPNGYPTVITNRGVYTAFDAPSQTVRPGNYVITWSGNGTIYCGMANTPVSGSKTSTTGSGRYVFSTTATTFLVGISAIGAPYITNLQVFHVNDEAALNAGEVFGARFKQRLAEANFGVIRFVNWQCGNTTNVTTWATRKPVDYVFYSGPEMRKALYAGPTTNVGSDYAVTMPNFQLVDKATVIVKFTASCNSACTLNVAGTGPIQILNHYCQPLASNSYPIGGTWQSYATLVYDATLNAWIKQGGDLARGSMGLDNGCPPELMLQLCAEVGAHPYFVTPGLAIDPATDYMPSLAAYCFANAPRWLIPRFEGPNETWNNASGFYTTQFAKAKATAYGWGPDVHNWYGKAVSVLGQIVSAAYGGNVARYQVLCGVQTATGASIAGTASSDPRLSSARYVAQTAAAQAPYTKTPAANWVTHVCCTQYFSPSEYATAQETLDAASYAATSDAGIRASLASAYAATANSGTGAFTVAKCAILYANWKTWAKRFNINKMCGYEGGYSPDYTGGGKTQVDQFRSASKQAPALASLATMNLNNFVALTDSTFTAEFPALFQLTGRAPSNNAWAILEDVYQTPNPPQWTAIVAFNH